MPKTIVDLCNLALSEMGARASIVDLNENSKEAKACKLHYDQVRNELLRAAHWGFARSQKALTQLGTASEETSQHPWLYMYAYPADCIKMRYLMQTPTVNTAGAEVVLVGDQFNGGVIPGPSRANRFLIGNNGTQRVVLTNVQAAIGVYTGDITNPALFDEGFAQAVVASLAAKLCIPISGNAGIKAQFEQLAFRRVQEARAADGNEALASTDHVPDWIRGRTGSLTADQAPGFWYAPWDSLSWGE